MKKPGFFCWLEWNASWEKPGFCYHFSCADQL
jgi:hypothetical protein